MAFFAGASTSLGPAGQGPGLQSGQDIMAAASADVNSTENGLVANGTTRATATQLRAAVNVFATVGASGQAILPKALPGTNLTLINAGASTLTVIGFLSTDTIDAGASQTLSTANRVAYLVCTDIGKWVSSLGGATMS